MQDWHDMVQWQYRTAAPLVELRKDQLFQFIKGHNVGSTANLKVGGEGEIDAGQQLDEDQQDY